METPIQLIRNGLRTFKEEDTVYYQLSSMLVWRHILSDLQKVLIKEVGMSYYIIRNFTIFISLAGIEETSIADEKEQSAIKELFKLKIGTKKEDVIFYRT